MLATTPAWAEWEMLGETDTAVHYLDLATIGTDGSLRRVWELQDLKLRLPNGERSRRTLFEYDCKEKRFRTISMSAFPGQMANGEILLIGSDPRSSGDWQIVPPGTVAQVALRLLCAR